MAPSFRYNCFIAFAIVISLAGSAFSSGWEGIEFPKFMYGDPTKAFRDLRDAKYEPKASHFDSIANLGINLFFTGIRYNTSDEKHYAILSDTYNRHRIPLVLGDFTPGIKRNLRYYNVAYALKGAIGKFLPRRLTEKRCGRFEAGHLRGNPGQLGAGPMAGNHFSSKRDFFVKPNLLQKGGSKCYLFINAHTAHPYYESDAILSIKVLGEMGPESTPQHPVYWEKTVRFHGSGFRNPSHDDTVITDRGTWYCITGDDTDWKMHRRSPVRILIESHGSIDLDVIVDSVMIFDEIGLQAAFNMMYDPANRRYRDFREDITGTIRKISALDKNGLILDWYIDEPRVCRLLNCVAIDKVISGNAVNPHRFHTERHWGNNAPDAVEGRHNYGAEYLESMKESGGSFPVWFMGQNHAYDCSKKGKIKDRQFNLSEYAGYKPYSSDWNYNIKLDEYQKGLLYYTYINKEYPEVKPSFEIQCEEDYWGWDNAKKRYILHFRNPRNKAEIKVLGYLALGYGIRALGYYYYFSMPSTPRRTGFYGIYDWRNNTWESAYCGDTNYGTKMPASGERKADAIRELNQDIDMMGYYLNNLRVAVDAGDRVRADYFREDEGAKCRAEFRYIRGIVKRDNARHIEVIELERTSPGDNIPPGDYFFIVNRDSSGMGLIEIHTDYSEGGGDRFLEIMNIDWSGLNSRVLGDAGNVSGLFDAELYIAPGCGLLFRIGDDFSWSGRSTIRGDFTIPPGMILEIAAGCTVQVFTEAAFGGEKSGGIVVSHPSSGIRINGSADNPVVFRSCYHCIADEEAGQRWRGLRFQGTAVSRVNLGNSRIRRCKIDNAEAALKTDSALPGGFLEITDCEFTNCDTTVYCKDSAILLNGTALSDTVIFSIEGK